MEKQKPDSENTVPLSLSRERQEQEDTFKNRIDTAAHELFADYFAENDFTSYRRKIRQAKMTTGYHMYLSRLTMYFIILSLASFLFASILTIASFFIGLNIQAFIPPLQGMTGVTLVTTVFFLLLIVSFILIAAIPCFLMYIYPWYLADERKRDIETNIPYAIIFMYALSRGGTTVLDMLRTVAESDETYGEISNEFNAIVREVDYFGTDISEAIRRASQDTPSPAFKQFSNDFVGIVESGGDIEKFLKDKSDEFLEQEEHKQENFLEILSIMGEIYVTGLVAGPLFVIVITTVMALVSGGQLGTLYMIIYGMLPLANIFFAFFVDVLQSGQEVESDVESDKYEPYTVEAMQKKYSKMEKSDERIESLIAKKKRDKYLDYVWNITGYIREKPYFTFAFSIPAVILYAFFVIVSGLVNPLEMTTDPIPTTTYLIVVPYIMLIAPFSVFYEMRIRRESKILKQLPTMLKKILASNETGLSLVDSFEKASGSMSGELGEELRYVQNEIRWRGDVDEALVRFANKVESGRLSRTVKLLTKANQYTGNLTEVIAVATRDIRNHTRLDRDRKSQMRVYTGIIIMSFFVYLIVIIILNQSFLNEIAAISEEMANQDGGEVASELQSSGGFAIASFEIVTYNMLFYHSAIIQAIGSGFIAGQMGSDNTFSGLKWSIILVLISAITFVFFL